MITTGDYWICDESLAESLPDPWDDGYNAAGIADYARFRARVDHVDGEYVVLEVTLGNGHPRTPAVGCTVVRSTDSLADSPRWRRKDDP